MAVGLGALDTSDGLGRCGDALGAAGQSNTPVDPHGGALKWWWCQYQQHTPRGGEGPYSPPIRGLGGLYLASQVYGE